MDGKAAHPIDWKARAGPSGRLGLIATTLAIVTGAVALGFLLGTPLSLTSLWLLIVVVASLGVGLALGLLTVGFYSLRYRLYPGSLVIDWLGQQETIAYDDIEAIQGGNRLGRARGPRFAFRGYQLGSGWAKGVGVVRFFTTSEDEADLTIIGTSRGTYALTPEDAPSFRRTLIAQLQTGVSNGASTRVREGLARLLPLTDGVAAFSLTASTVLLLATVGVALNRWDGLPEQVPLYLDAAGQALLSGPKERLLWLPGIGALLMIANALLGSLVAPSERVLARVLWLASPVVQAMLLVSMLRLVAA